MRHLWQGSDRLLQYGLCVATTSSENHGIIWNGTNLVVTLHQKSEMIRLFYIMILIEYNDLVLSTLSAYYISPVPAETEEGQQEK